MVTETPRVVAVVQARMGSTRLPGKSLTDLGGKSVLARCVDRLRPCVGIDAIIVATSTRAVDDAIETECRAIGVGYFRGSEDDVLQRLCQAARSAGGAVMVRVCGEDTLLDPGMIDAGIRVHLESDADLTTNVPLTGFPDDWPYVDGFDVEVVSVETLERVAGRDLEIPDREHVTRYLRHHPEEFHIVELPRDPDFRLLPPRSFAVDGPEDLAFMRLVYQTYRDAAFIDARDVVQRVREGGLA